MHILFSLSLFLLIYVYYGYLVLLKIILFFHSKSANVKSNLVQNNKYLPKVTILLTVYNEEEKIKDRVENILKCNYPAECLEVIVASDGSTDNTDSITKNFLDTRVNLFRPKMRVGKTDTQNMAIQKTAGEIIIFTDADTVFEYDFIINIVENFYNDSVGCATGNLNFYTDKNAVSVNQGLYWSYEQKIRASESELGILATASGACMAVRKNIFKRIDSAYGEDCIVPLDVALSGHLIIYDKRAIAYDKMESSSKSEFNTRVRMTLRNWQGLWSKSELLNPFKFPFHAFSLWSHKILRWLSPFFLIMLTFSSIALSVDFIFFLVFSYGLALFYVLGFFGWLFNLYGLTIPFVSTIYSFLLANFGFLIGLLKSFSGYSIRLYR